MTVEETRPHDSISPQAATAATALTLVSCSGIRQIYHGNRETEQEKYKWERGRWWSHVCGIQYSNKVGILGFLLLKTSYFSLHFSLLYPYLSLTFTSARGLFLFLCSLTFLKIQSQKYFLEIFGALYSNSSTFYMMYYICCQNRFCELL